MKISVLNLTREMEVLPWNSSHRKSLVKQKLSKNIKWLTLIFQRLLIFQRSEIILLMLKELTNQNLLLKSSKTSNITYSS